MKKRLIIPVLILFVFFNLNIAAFASPSGTEDDPVIISSAEAFENISKSSEYADYYYSLEADIVLNANYTPKMFYANLVGGMKSGGKSYSITLYMSTNSYAGLFTAIYGTVKNIEIKGNVSGGSYVGGICGRVYPGGRIENCVNSASVSGTGSAIGGICGYMDGGAVINCINNGNVQNTNANGRYTAGIVSFVASTNENVISGCVNNGEVRGEERIGGIAGYVSLSGDSGLLISYCRNSGNLATNASKNVAGGIAGYVDSGNSFEITKCCNTGNLSANSYIGGIVGNDAAGIDINNCFNIGNLINNSTSLMGGICAFSNATRISKCYNVGLSSVESTYNYPIAGYYSTKSGSPPVISDCYYTSDMQNIRTVSGMSVITNIGWRNMYKEKTLPDGFSEELWKYDAVNPSRNKYALPKLNNLSWEKDFVQPFEIFEISIETQSVFVPSDGIGKLWCATVKIYGEYAGVSAHYTMNESCEITEFGAVLMSDDGKIIEYCRGDIAQDDGKYAMIFLGDGIKSGKDYLTCAYIKYRDSENILNTLYGETLQVKIK